MAQAIATAKAIERTWRHRSLAHLTTRRARSRESPAGNRGIASSAGIGETLPGVSSPHVREEAPRSSAVWDTVASSSEAPAPPQKTEVFSSDGEARATFGMDSDRHVETVASVVSSSDSEDTGEFTALGQAWIEKTRPDSPAGAAPAPKTGPQGYEILGELGRGGMGIVYKARHLRLNRLVALKMIRGALADEIQIARFKIEAEAVASLRHPNILQIYDIGEHNGAPYVALELLEGGSLYDRLNRTPLPPRQAAEWMLPLVMAMDAAHQSGIVHRDLKSANILFSASGIPKITDFGLAKRLEMDEGQTHTGQVMGTPSYMAPEQARGETKSAGPPADIYALARSSTRCSPAGLPSRGFRRWIPSSKSSRRIQSRPPASSFASRATSRQSA